MPQKTKEKWEFGDFQTPFNLALAVTRLLQTSGIQPKSVIEPTCGKGAFVRAAGETFGNAEQIKGVEINPDYAETLRTAISGTPYERITEVTVGDYFFTDWKSIIAALPEPILVLGNPPWVTSAELSLLKSTNVPGKSNFQNHKGYDALTGKSNFDISEWMLLKQLDWFSEKRGVVAMLCKTSVARKVMRHVWTHSVGIAAARIYLVDALKHFEAAVDSCLFMIDLSDKRLSQPCLIFNSLTDTTPSQEIGFADGFILSSTPGYHKWSSLIGGEEHYFWRSGIKHDCSKVMELEKSNESENCFKNGIGTIVNLDDQYLYPMLKSSDLANEKGRLGKKYMLVTQKFIGENTLAIKTNSTKTWEYLSANADLLQQRGSSIYRNRPDFSVFGVGDYSFAPWKVAISGFYKSLNFKVIGPYNGKPVVFDDTVNFLSCNSEAEALFIAGLLNADPVKELLDSMIFWNDKRPITIELLKRLNFKKISSALGKINEYSFFADARRTVTAAGNNQILLFAACAG